MALTAPAMTPAEIAAVPVFAPPVRVTCYPCGVSLFVGDEVPDGGADAVFAAAGCAEGTCPGKDPAAYPAPPVVVDLTASAPAAEPVAIGSVGQAPGIAFAVPAEPAAAVPVHG